MSLKLLQPGIQPLGQFDGYDADYLTVKGGEVCTFGGVPTSSQPGVTVSGDKAAYDAFDGYVNPAWPAAVRPVVTHTFSGSVLFGVSTASRPLMLTDDGIAGYGTLFGSVVGGVVGQVSTGGSVLGPHTATGSGKITCWEKPGLYAVSLDAVDTNASTGLQPTNTALSVGSAVSFVSTTGVLTPGTSNGVVGRLVEFATNGSLVTTPNSLVAALNSPSGNVSSVGPRSFAYAVIYFNPPTT